MEKLNLTDKEIRAWWREWCSDRSTGKPFPEVFRKLACGARTRKGTPCQQKGLYKNSRCKLHGGLSTGPKTNEGKRKSSLNGLIKKANSRDTEAHEVSLKLS